MKKRLLSFRYAFQGLFHLFRGQPNAWIHLIAAIGVIIAGFLCGLSVTEWGFIIFAIGMVFAAELFNSAIEELVNKISPEHDLVAGKIKDLAAGAVLVAAISAAILGLLIFLPKLIVH
ncbi:MAG: diacylglycerol kinase family protein [Bacteroidales bacterium]|nr:diacylglycerol kinase family protein [Bacteroidales bacterium]